MEHADTAYGGISLHPDNSFYELTKPWSPHEIGLIQQAKASLLATPEQIRGIRPPLPQVMLFGPPPQSEPVTIDYCFALSRYVPDAHNDFSGSPAGFTGSSRLSLGVW